MKLIVSVSLALSVMGTAAVAQQPLIASFGPDGTITWTNMSTNCVAVIEELSPVTRGQWNTVHAELPTSTVSQVQLSATNEHAWFRAVNADNSAAPTNMVLIPGGSNSGTNPLGSGESHDSCLYPPIYSLSVGSFYMDRYEVTNDEMVDVLQWAYEHNPPLITVSASTVRNAAGNQQELLDLDYSACRITWDAGTETFGLKAAKGSGYPCVEVTWCGAAAYCNYRSEKEGRPACYNLSDWSCNVKAGGYRLPTSEEWEYAARGGAGSKRFSWGGDTISHSQANYSASTSDSYDQSSGGYHPSYNTGGYPYTSPVGAFAANAYGLYDMSGNVEEWCSDWHWCYVGSHRVLRGGSWITEAYFCRVGYRYRSTPAHSNSYSGFRAVSTPPP